MFQLKVMIDSKQIGSGKTLLGVQAEENSEFQMIHNWGAAKDVYYQDHVVLKYNIIWLSSSCCMKNKILSGYQNHVV